MEGPRPQPAGAAAVAQQYPQYAGAITSAAKSSFLKGANWAYGAGAIATVAGIVLVFVLFPNKDDEQRLLEGYQTADTGQEKAGSGGGLV